MKTAYFTITGESFTFLGFFANCDEAVKASPQYLAVVSIDFLYRTIEEAKNALNNIPLE
jgi:hypothetical protein